MNDRIISGRTQRIYVILGFLGLLAMQFVDIIYLRGRIFDKEIPSVSMESISRGLVVILSVAAITYGLTYGKNLRIQLGNNEGLLPKKGIIGISLFLGTFFLLLFLIQPSIFGTLSLEDHIIEWGSTILLFGCSAIFLWTVLIHGKFLKKQKVIILLLLLFSATFFVIAMEEISWFQRVLDIETPESFSGNWQGEMNFHNFSTNWAENLYYFGSFIFLVGLPFIDLLFPKLFNKYKLSILIPAKYIAISVALAFAYNYSMWDTLLIQFTFFSSLAILIIFAVNSHRSGDKRVIFFTIILVVMTQGLFLLNGSYFTRNWEVTEYKEFFIPLGFFCYALNVYTRTNKTIKTRG